jgi:UDPglucose 6-dehydrogenase
VGYGGSCFPKDVDALIRTASSINYGTRVLRAVTEVNHDQRLRMVARIREHFGKNIRGKLIALWGLAFKPNTDDMREAPSIEIIRGILESGGKVCAYDPVAMDQARKIFQNKIRYGRSPYDAIKKASALVIITEWNEFRRPNFTKLRELLADPVIFDGRNLYEPNLMKTLGFHYYSIGRKPIKSID